MKLDLEDLINMLKTMTNTRYEGRALYTQDIQVLLEVALLPSQTHKFYGEKVGLNPTGNMSQVVRRLRWCGLLESKLNPKSPGHKALTLTKQGIEFIEELQSLGKPKDPKTKPKPSRAKPKPIIRHRNLGSRYNKKK